MTASWVSYFFSGISVTLTRLAESRYVLHAGPALTSVSALVVP